MFSFSTFIFHIFFLYFQRASFLMDVVILSTLYLLFYWMLYNWDSALFVFPCFINFINDNKSRMLCIFIISCLLLFALQLGPSSAARSQLCLFFFHVTWPAPPSSNKNNNFHNCLHDQSINIFIKRLNGQKLRWDKIQIRINKWIMKVSFSLIIRYYEG